MRRFALILVTVIVLFGTVAVVNAKFCYDDPVNVCVWSGIGNGPAYFDYGPSYTVQPGGSVPLPLYIENRGTHDIVVTMNAILYNPQGSPTVYHILNNVVPMGQTGSFGDAVLVVPSGTFYGEYHLTLDISEGKVGDPTTNYNSLIPRDSNDYPVYVLPAGVTGFDDIITVPVRPCVMENSPGAYECDCDANGKYCKACPVGSYVTGKQIRQDIFKADEEDWTSKAHIIFIPASGTNGIPVIKDKYGFNGDGEITGYESDAAGDCRIAWAGGNGLAMVDAVMTNGVGVSLGPLDLNNLKSRLCKSPRDLTSSDVEFQYVTIREKLNQDVPNTIAHELGHTLLLGHGNGIDDNGDSTGALPTTGFESGLAGTRLFDWCDPLGITGEDQVPVEDNGHSCATNNLMCGYILHYDLTPLQIEQARAVARVHPGATLGSSANPQNIDLTPRVLQPGGTTTVHLHGLPPNTVIDLRVGSSFLTSVTTDAAGTAQATIVIPSTLTEGLHFMVGEIRGAPSFATASFITAGSSLTPATQVQVTPPASGYGWYNGTVTMSFTATNVPGGPGIAMIHYASTGAETKSLTMNGPTGTQTVAAPGVTTVTYSAEDTSGKKEAPNTLIVKIDAAKPSITSTPDPAANGNGWNTGPVTLTFTCSDDQSGIASCSPPVTITSEGKDQQAEGSATDLAWNTADLTVSGINIDKTPPVITIITPKDAAEFAIGQQVKANYSATDALSGIDTVTGSIPNGQKLVTTAPGSYAFCVTATDKAGNTATTTNAYTIYVPAKVTFRHKIINLARNGAFVAAIKLPRGYPAANVDKTSVQCNGAFAKRVITTRYYPQSLLAIFKTSELQGVVPGEKVRLTVSGNLTGNLKFKGSDVIRVMKRGDIRTDEIADWTTPADTALLVKYNPET